MRKNKHGYVPAAILLNTMINEMREHVEFEKFLCRMIKDDETTQEFKKNTDVHKNSLYRFRYNSESVDAHTSFGKSNVSK
jgi:hypothetical protein